MQWSDAIKPFVSALKPVKNSPELMHRVISLVDYTTLNDKDTDESVLQFVSKAITPIGHVAAVCIFPQFVKLVAMELQNKPIKIATVSNFPSGDESIENCLIEINQALEDGAQEIDVVFPYQRFFAGDEEYARVFVESCKAACGYDVQLKVILETGAYKELNQIAKASGIALQAGADFIKTSTGKISVGATLEAAATMLLVIKELSPHLKRPLGFKASGGIREVEQAAQYIELADLIMGRDWTTAKTFRIGASKLVDEILAVSKV